MKLMIAGIGPGKNELITLEAVNFARSSDIIIVPRSKQNKQGIAEAVMMNHLPERKFLPIYFPMIKDEIERSKIIHEQLINSKSEWHDAKNIFFPVIGDVALYSTGAYLLDQMRKIIPDLSVEFVPGISAHSLAASCAKRFLAMNDEIFAIIPGTANPEKIIQALKAANSAAIYKPSAIKNIHAIINPDEYKILRVDFAGIPELEKIISGSKALENLNQYLSILLLWKNF